MDTVDTDERQATLHAGFSVVAKAFPDRPALVTEDRVIDYAELRRWMLAVAASLPGVRPDEIVGLCAGRSPAVVAAMLGILQAGGAYLPLDPRLPDRRLSQLIEDSGARLLLTDSAREARLRALAPAHVRVIVIAEPMAIPPESEPAVSRSTGEDLAYVLYTSGSTGDPKGVMVQHESVVALARDAFADVRSDDVFFQLTPLHADPSAFEIWTPLLNGASLVIPPEGDLTVDEIGDRLRRHGVTVLRLVAPLFALVVETGVAALRGLRLLISGGDRASEKAVRTALAELPGCTVVNAYGPTESTVFALTHPMTAYDDAWPSVPIGTPLRGTTAHILGETGEAAEEGELHLGGTGLARGYLGRPDLTADRFTRLPGSGERVYRTGDRVRRLPDGNLVFVGRLDDQVKIRGFRVEPGEVETVLTRHPAVREAAVVARDGHLEAFVRLAEGSAVALGEYLAGLLPAPLVPAFIEAVDDFPRLENGKLDRRALAARSGRAPRRAPGTGLEREVAAIWSAALRREAGLDDSFLDLGGDSLAAMDIVARVTRRLGARLPLTAVFEASTLAEFTTRVGLASGNDGAVTATEGRARAPLSAGQEGVWFDDHLSTAGNYTIARTFRVRGKLDETAFRTALRTLARRQDALRIVVEEGPEGPRQVVRDDGTPTVRHADLTTVAASEREKRARALVEEATREPFGPSRPLVRVLLVSLGEDRTILHFTLHHVIADDWSLDILFDELSLCYRAARAGTEPNLPALEVRYLDFVAARHAERAAVASRTVPAMARLLSAYPGVIELPTDHPAPVALSGQGDRVRLRLDPELTGALATVAREARVSRAMVATAAVYLLLAKYSGGRDICVGTPVAGRDHPGSGGLIGYFVSMVPVRVNPGEIRTVTDLLAHVRTACLDTYRHAEVPLPDLARAVGLHAQGGRFPLFQVVLGYQQRPPRALSLSGAEVTPWETPAGTAKFDLGFAFEEGESGIGGTIEFSTDLFDRESVERMAGHLVNIFRWLAAHPDGALRELKLLGPAEEHLVRVEWNRTALEFPRDHCLHELISERARDRSAKVAVIGPDATLTYGELEAHSDRLAARLARAGVGPDDRVAICVERSARQVVAILGVLKAGGACVPLDPSYPAERLRFIESDARASALITSAALRRKEDDTGAAIVIDIDEPLPDETFTPRRRARPDNLAYLIYTSGSTGRPKGVAIEHRAVVNMLYGHMAWYSFDETDVWSQFAAVGFDMAVYECLMPLLTGATSVIASDDERMDGRLFVDFVEANRITVQVSSPAFLRSLGQPALPTVRALITGGEVANLPDVAFYAPRKTFLNCYGPTEVTICTTSYRAVGTETLPRLPIGRPQPNTTLYIVDAEGQLCPVGVPGEIHIGGLGLARGYWDDPELTSRRFITLPSVGGERLYRTGDRARWLPDGTVDFLGRIDSYVKFRGYRVEPGEIEALLIAHPGVSQAAVLIRDDSLIAFVTGDASSGVLRSYLAERLPYYMVPGHFVALGTMPMTEHVKIDRRALATMIAEPVPSAGPGEPAGTPTEVRVTGLWAGLLGVPTVDPGADFFVLGGHSLLIARLLDLVETEFGTRIGVRDFLAAPTVAGLAARIDGLAPTGDTVPATEAELEPGLRFPAVTAPAADPGAVLLTGATGFVGAFLLRELLTRTTGDVLCLVRASSPDHARQRIRETARAYRLGVDPADPRIVPVPGDLARQGLGLGPAERERLAAVDAIFHAGAQVNHLSPYDRLKAANVEGTAELLRLAATGRPKRFHQISSISVFTGEAERTVTEETSVERERHFPGRGYSATKWIADRMVELAMGRGLAGRIYRIGRMSGDSVHGVANVDDMFYRLLISCAVLRCYPDDERLHTNLLPVDVAARALVALALDGGDGPNAYHVHHHQTATLAGFMRVFDQIHKSESEALPLTAWLRRVRTAPGELPVRPYEPTLWELAGSTAGSGSIKYSNAVTHHKWESLGVEIPGITDALIARYWRFLAEGGHLG